MDREKRQGAVIPIPEVRSGNGIDIKVRHMTEQAAQRAARKAHGLPWVIVTSKAQADNEILRRVQDCLERYGQCRIVKAPGFTEN